MIYASLHFVFGQQHRMEQNKTFQYLCQASRALAAHHECMLQAARLGTWHLLCAVVRQGWPVIHHDMGISAKGAVLIREFYRLSS